MKNTSLTPTMVYVKHSLKPAFLMHSRVCKVLTGKDVFLSLYSTCYGEWKISVYTL